MTGDIENLKTFGGSSLAQAAAINFPFPFYTASFTGSASDAASDMSSLFISPSRLHWAYLVPPLDYLLTPLTDPFAEADDDTGQSQAQSAIHIRIQRMANFYGGG